MARAGRPLKFSTVEDMQSKIDAYFADCDKNGRPYTIVGLAYDLDCSRSTLFEYENGNEESFKRLSEAERQAFSNTINRAKDKVERYSAELLLKKEGSTKGIEFNLSNNHRWADKQIIENTNLNIDATTLTPEDRAARLAELKAKLLED